MDIDALTHSQQWILARHTFDPFKVEDLGDREEIDEICRSLVELNILERRERERTYFSQAQGLPFLRREHYYRPKDPADEIWRRVADIFKV